jgi:diguanylate cyclase (GGDEF)-like protein/PAS domain S-box-containing protein
MSVLQAAMDLSVIGMALIGLDGLCQCVNPALCTMLGYSAAELLDQGLRETVFDADRVSVVDVIQTLQLGRPYPPREKRYRHRDGHTIWFKLSIAPQRDTNGKLLALMAQMQDITQEKKTQETLGKNALRLNRIIATQSLLASAQLNLDAFMTLVVNAMQAITPATGAVIELVEGDDMVYRAASGSVAGFVGMRLKRIGSLSGRCVEAGKVMSAPDTRTDNRVDADACRRVGAGSMIVAPLFKEDSAVGVLKVLAVTPHAFDDEDVNSLQLMAGLLGAALAHQINFEAKQRLLAERTRTLADLTRSEASLRASEARTRHIIDNSLDAFISMDEAGNITEWNPQAEHLFGWSRAEVLGQRLADLIIPPGRRQAHAEGLLEFGQAHAHHMLDRRVELQALTRDGHEIPVEMAVNAVSLDGNTQFNAFLHDITKRKQNEASLQLMAQYDLLTGLPNRRLFYDRLEQALARNPRNPGWLTLMYLDVDHFKHINDTLGHAIGDALLQAFTSRISAAVRASDTLARLGGDEFTLIAENVRSPEEAGLIAQKIVELAAQPFELEEHRVLVSASIGITLVGKDETDAESIIRRADGALYQAKGAGRNTWRLAQG